ncbi:hypothetical protein ACTXJU_17955, partial [Glutamicibacter ardleyensis]|uniref:hypothetical protein n=1 Tax=Glutamicibacter ardleyensis TaxID=225894 RepID=UPI003FD4AD3A
NSPPPLQLVSKVRAGARLQPWLGKPSHEHERHHLLGSRVSIPTPFHVNAANARSVQEHDQAVRRVPTRTAQELYAVAALLLHQNVYSASEYR